MENKIKPHPPIKTLEIFLYSNAMHWINMVLVSLNAIVIALQTAPGISPQHYHFLENIILGFVGIFAVEIAAKLILRGRQFFNRPGDPFSLAVLALAIVSQTPNISVLLAFNLLRAFRALNFSPRARQILDALTDALPSIFNIILIIALAYAIFAILGTRLFAQGNPDYFGSIATSLMTLSQIMVGDDWGSILRKSTSAYPYSALYLFAFLVLIAFVFLNTFIGVIVDAIGQQFGNKVEEGDGAADLEALQKALKDIKQDVARLSKEVEKNKQV